MEDREAPGARGVVRALRVLELFTKERPAIGVAAVAEALDVPRPTAHRTLVALAGRGYLRQDHPGAPYALGPRVLALAEAYEASDPLARIAAPHLQRLLDTTGESAGLHVRHGADARVCIRRVVSAHPMQIVIPVGVPMPLRLGAAGRVLRMSDAEAQRFEPVVTRGERVPNAGGVAAAIVDHRGRLRGAVDVSGPLDRFREEALDGFRVAVAEAGRAISLQLGFPA